MMTTTDAHDHSSVLMTAPRVKNFSALQILDVHEGHLDSALKSFEDVRMPDVRALAHLDIISPDVRLQTDAICRRLIKQTSVEFASEF